MKPRVQKKNTLVQLRITLGSSASVDICQFKIKEFFENLGIQNKVDIETTLSNYFGSQLKGVSPFAFVRDPNLCPKIQKHSFNQALIAFSREFLRINTIIDLDDEAILDQSLDSGSLDSKDELSHLLGEIDKLQRAEQEKTISVALSQSKEVRKQTLSEEKAVIKLEEVSRRVGMSRNHQQQMAASKQRTSSYEGSTAEFEEFLEEVAVGTTADSQMSRSVDIETQKLGMEELLMTAGFPADMLPFLVSDPKVSSDIDESIRILRFCIQKGKEIAERVKDKDIVAVLGGTGSGKSTTINLLLGHTLTKIYPEGTRGIVDIAHFHPDVSAVAKIGHNKKVSQTIMPELFESSDHTLYCDFPGYNESRSRLLRLANAFNICSVLRNAKSVKVICLMTQATVEADRGALFIKYQQLLLGMLGQRASVALGLTKVIPGEEEELLSDVCRNYLRDTTLHAASNTMVINPTIAGERTRILKLLAGMNSMHVNDCRVFIEKDDFETCYKLSIGIKQIIMDSINDLDNLTTRIKSKILVYFEFLSVVGQFADSQTNIHELINELVFSVSQKVENTIAREANKNRVYNLENFKNLGILCDLYYQFLNELNTCLPHRLIKQCLSSIRQLKKDANERHLLYLKEEILEAIAKLRSLFFEHCHTDNELVLQMLDFDLDADIFEKLTKLSEFKQDVWIVQIDRLITLLDQLHSVVGRGFLIKAAEINALCVDMHNHAVNIQNKMLKQRFIALLQDFNVLLLSISRNSLEDCQKVLYVVDSPEKDAFAKLRNFHVVSSEIADLLSKLTQTNKSRLKLPGSNENRNVERLSATLQCIKDEAVRQESIFITEIIYQYKDNFAQSLTSFQELIMRLIERSVQHRAGIIKCFEHRGGESQLSALNEYLSEEVAIVAVIAKLREIRSAVSSLNVSSNNAALCVNPGDLRFDYATVLDEVHAQVLLVEQEGIEKELIRRINANLVKNHISGLSLDLCSLREVNPAAIAQVTIEFTADAYVKNFERYLILPDAFSLLKTQYKLIKEFSKELDRYNGCLNSPFSDDFLANRLDLAGAEEKIRTIIKEAGDEVLNSIHALLKKEHHDTNFSEEDRCIKKFWMIYDLFSGLDPFKDQFTGVVAAINDLYKNHMSSIYLRKYAKENGVDNFVFYVHILYMLISYLPASEAMITQSTFRRMIRASIGELSNQDKHGMRDSSLIEAFSNIISMQYIKFDRYPMLSEHTQLIVDQYPMLRRAKIQNFNKKVKVRKYNDIKTEMDRAGTFDIIQPGAKSWYVNAYHHFDMTYYSKIDEFSTRTGVARDYLNSYVSEVKSAAGEIKKLKTDSNSSDNNFSSKLGKLVGYIFCVWSTLDIMSDDVAVDVAREDVRYLQPHPTQVLSVLIMLGNQLGVQNRFLQIKTGEGKSLVIAVAAVALAAMGYEVDVSCYSQYLADRDKHLYKDLINIMGRDIEWLITYEQFDSLVSTRAGSQIEGLNHPGDVNKFLQGKVPQRKCESSTENRILIADEVDMFFGEAFLGGVTNLDYMYSSAALTELVELMWKNRVDYLSQDGVDFLFELPAVKRILVANKRLGKGIFRNTLFGLKSALKSVHSGGYSPPEYDRQKKQFGKHNLMTGDWSHFGLHAGLAFHYLDKRSEFNYAMRESFCTFFHLGGIATVNLLNQYKGGILGVTADLSNFTKFQIDILNEHEINYKIKIPSPFSKIVWDGNPPTSICDNADSHFRKIRDSAQKVASKGRAVLVIFEDEKSLKNYEDFLNREGEYSVGKAQLLTIMRTPIRDRDAVIISAARARKVTHLTKFFGRGSDFICRDDKVIAQGGVHVIQTFFAEDKTDEIQCRGRTRRQDNPGTYEIIANAQKLDAFKAVYRGDDFNEKLQDASCYRFLSDLRSEGLDVRRDGKTKEGYVNALSKSRDTTTLFRLFSSSDCEEQAQAESRLLALQC